MADEEKILSFQFAFAQFDSAKFDATRQAWTADAQADSTIFPGDVSYALSVAAKQEYSGNGDGMGFGIFEPGSDEAVGVVEVFISQVGRKWLKMIDCRVRPSLLQAVFREDAEAIARMLALYASALEGVLRLHAKHKTTAVRIYGRHELFLKFLKQIALAIQAKSSGEVSADVQGRWLVVQL